MKMIVNIEFIHETDKEPVQDIYLSSHYRFAIKNHDAESRKKLSQEFERVTNEIYRQWDLQQAAYEEVEK